MRKIILSIPITLDGYIEGPHRELDWVIADDELHDFYSDLLEQTDLILYGRVTYELMVSYWPNATADPTLSKGMLRYANTVNPMKKMVYSTTLKNAGWNTQVNDVFIPEEIMKMKEQPGRDIALGGGAALAQAFIQNGLVDEYQLLVQPVVIGDGKPLFKGIQDVLKLNYLWSRPFHSGSVALCYRPDVKI
jgi:dihydrofolate reductase